LNRGYKIVETHEDGCNLSRKGIHTTRKRKIYQKMWHPWLPKKVSYDIAYNGRRIPINVNF